MNLQFWTRALDSEEMADLFVYVESLVPPYTIRDGQKADKIRDGGRIMMNMQASHKSEAVYIKTKWG